MKVSIDFSVFTKEDGAFGNISGEITTITAPQQGDQISFAFPDKTEDSNPITAFTGSLAVVNRTIMANRSDQPLLLSLSDITLTTTEDAIRICNYFENTFNLLAIIYND